MQKISIKREQSQAGLSFAERLRVGEPCSGMREKFRPQVKNKLLLLLVLLLTAATGAWADEVTFSVGELKNSLPSGNTTIEIPYEWTVSSQQPKVTIARQDGMPGNLSVSTLLPLGKDHTMTVSVPTGGSIDGVTFTTNPANQAQNISASTGSCSKKGIWSPGEGDVTSVTFTPTNNFRITDIVVVYSPAPAVAVPKHLITATYREQTRSLEQPLPYATTIGELYEAVTGKSFSDLISSMSAVEMPLTGISSNNTSVVSIGELNGASTPVTVIADGKATISLNFGSYAHGIFVSVTSPLYAYMKDGVKDADKWTVKVGDGEAQALPIGGLKGDGSETVTLQYTGRLKVKGVKATSDEKPAAPSVTEVTTFSELQAALSAGKDVKLMNDIVCTEEINITSGALTIDGNGKELSTTSAIRAFKVGSSATVAFKNLIITGFVSGGGPAINNSGTIVLDECTIVNCHVNNTNGGGAIENKGKLYAIKTAFSGNYSGEIGGAINNYMGSLYMSLCTFINNYTSKSDAYYGGAIGINGGSEVRLINCYFSENKYGTNPGTNDIGVYNKPTNYTIAGCTGANIASRNGDITTIATGTATLDYSDLSNISFTVEQAAKPAATVTTAPTGAAIVGVGKNTALVSGGAADGGTLMYAVTTTNTKPASTDGFSDKVPTAQDITASGTVYVWYYVKGDGTHTDSEISATPIVVPVADIVWDVTNITDIYVDGYGNSYEMEGITLSAAGDKYAWWDGGISFTLTESGGYTFTAPAGKAFTKIEMIALGNDGWDEAYENEELGHGWAFNTPTVTWTGSAASTVDLLTGTDEFDGDNVISIGFYLSE